MYCPKCAEENPKDAKHCGQCGNRLVSDTPSGSGSGWEKIFKWIGIGVVALFVLAVLANM